MANVPRMSDATYEDLRARLEIATLEPTHRTDRDVTVGVNVLAFVARALLEGLRDAHRDIASLQDEVASLRHDVELQEEALNALDIPSTETLEAQVEILQRELSELEGRVDDMGDGGAQ